VHDFVIKHGKTLLVYSAYGEGFGNPKHPSKGETQRSRYGAELIQMQKTTTYSNVDIKLSVLDPETMLVQHKRTYDIENISNEPIKHVLHGIATDVDKYSINDLNVDVIDEAGREMKISSINVDRPTCKEFTTEFNTPIAKDDKGRQYTISYEVEEPERYFENAFMIDVSNFSFYFQYPKSFKCTPKIYDINQETEEKTLADQQPVIETEGNYKIAKYEKHENIKGETIRLEW